MPPRRSRLKLGGKQDRLAHDELGDLDHLCASLSHRRVKEPAGPALQCEGCPTRPCRRPGLTNLGDCCFVSSVVQALYSCETVRRGLAASEGEGLEHDVGNSCTDFASLVARALPALMREMSAACVGSLPLRPIAPQALVCAVRGGAGSVFASGQHDAHELLQQLLLLPEAEPRTLKQPSPQVGHTRRARAAKAARVAAASGPRVAIQSLQKALCCFQGAVSSATCCLECECSTKQHDEVFTTLSVCCAHSNSETPGPTVTSVASGLAGYFRVEHMRGRNKVFCIEHCNALAEAHRRTQLTKLPKILCVHVKVLEETASRAIAVDQELELRPWCAVVTNRCTRYELVAAVFHTGNSPHCGHYTTCCRTNAADRLSACLRPRSQNVDLGGTEAPLGAWLRCDDEHIEALDEVETQEMLRGDGDIRKGSTPYLCFYAQMSDDFAT